MPIVHAADPLHPPGGPALASAVLLLAEQPNALSQKQLLRAAIAQAKDEQHGEAIDEALAFALGQAEQETLEVAAVDMVLQVFFLLVLNEGEDALGSRLSPDQTASIGQARSALQLARQIDKAGRSRYSDVTETSVLLACIAGVRGILSAYYIDLLCARKTYRHANAELLKARGLSFSQSLQPAGLSGLPTLSQTEAEAMAGKLREARRRESEEKEGPQ
jgi:hypothetical protein